METLRLRGCDISVSRIAFGAEPLGGFDWGSVDVEEVERAVGRALDLGITLFDTADCYGRGEFEARLGRTLRSRRQHCAISTKFGVRFDQQNRVYYDNSVDYIETSLDDSLRRLGTDYVDLFQLHWPDGRTPLEAVFDRLERMRESGKICAYGVSNVPPEMLLPHTERPGLASFSLQYSLAHRMHEDAIRKVCAAGLLFLSWGSLGQGVLSGRYRSDQHWPQDDRRRRAIYENFHGEKLARNLKLVECLKDVAKSENHYGPTVCALRFILDNLPAAVALVGVKSRAQIEQNCQAGERPMSAESLARLLAESAPP